LHPALSIILFTTLSGAGYGLLFWLGLLWALDLLPPERGLALAALLLALAATAAGLVASTFHLGHPERAWRALSQWRSSWLSREGIAALATFVPACALVWRLAAPGHGGGAWDAVALLAALGAVVTVTCTAYIYRSLKPIPRWHNRWVVPNYLALAAMTGALWLAALAAAFAVAPPHLIALALAAILAAAGLKTGYWRFIDRDDATATAGAATGLGALGEVRLFEAPHTSANYLQKEMGFRIARKHATKLRRLAVIAAFLLPFALTVLTPPLGHVAGALSLVIAAISAQLGVIVERWLFFAEAKHMVTLYYGAAKV
jgi:sulfite dehydrogenase (quinone) subunit SoeC